MKSLVRKPLEMTVIRMGDFYPQCFKHTESRSNAFVWVRVYVNLNLNLFKSI